MTADAAVAQADAPPTTALIETPAAEVITPPAASLVSPDAGAESADERRGRRRRRRRGRGGRAGEEGASATDAEAAADESFAETDLLIEVQAEAETTQPALPLAEPVAMAPVQEAAPAVTPVLERVAAPVAGNGNGSAAPLNGVPARPAALAAAGAAPMPVEQLQSMLQAAGLTLVQTSAARFEETRLRMQSEPRAVRVPRERPMLPPLDSGPLVQVETRHA